MCVENNFIQVTSIPNEADGLAPEYAWLQYVTPLGSALAEGEEEHSDGTSTNA